MQDSYSDITLVVDGQRFVAHKVVLAARSEYFRLVAVCYFSLSLSLSLSLFSSMRGRQQLSCPLLRPPKMRLLCSGFLYGSKLLFYFYRCRIAASSPIRHPTTDDWLYRIMVFNCLHRQCTSIPRGIVPTSRRCRNVATSLICHPTAPSCTTPPAQLLWPTSFLCGWSVGLEFPAGQLAEYDYWWEQF